MKRYALYIYVMFFGLWAGVSLADDQKNDLCTLPISLRPASCPINPSIAALPQPVRENHVFFPGGGAFLDAHARAQLVLLAKALKTPVLKGACLRLVGHADSSGPADVNYQLSRLRAQAVADFLMAEMGQESPPMTVLGMGESDLMADVPKYSVVHRRVALEARPCP